MTELTETILEYYATIGGITIVWEIGRWVVTSVVSFITSGDVDL